MKVVRPVLLAQDGYERYQRCDISTKIPLCGALPHPSFPYILRGAEAFLKKARERR